MANRKKLSRFSAACLVAGAVVAPSAAAFAAEGSASAAAACTGPEAIKSVTYFVNGQPVSWLQGGTQQNDTLSVQFEVADGCTDVKFGLAAYLAPGTVWSPEIADQQKLSVQQTSVFSAGGVNSLSLTIPDCYYQVDFFTGPVLQSLSSTSYYSLDGRLIAWDNGGDEVCATPSETTLPRTTTTTIPSTSTTVPNSTSTTLPGSTSTTSSTLPDEVLGEVVERPQVESAQLAETGVDTRGVMGLGSALTLTGAALSGLAVKVRRRGSHFRR